MVRVHSGLLFHLFFIPPDFARDAVSQNVLSEISGPPKDIRTGALPNFAPSYGEPGKRPGPKRMVGMAKRLAVFMYGLVS
jgi:hypothetical protein